MCGRVAQFMSWAETYELLSYRGPQPSVEIIPRYNIPPDTRLQVLLDAGGEPLPASTKWGWAPYWATDRHRPSNARADQVASSPFWWIVWPHRMLMPINGWFEWTGEKGNKRPWFIRRRDGRLTLCATVSQVHHEEPQPGDGVAIITAASTGGMVGIHDRRPVAFTPELAREWLDPATTRERARDMLEHGEGPRRSSGSASTSRRTTPATTARRSSRQKRQKARGLHSRTPGLDHLSTRKHDAPQILYIKTVFRSIHHGTLLPIHPFPDIRQGPPIRLHLQAQHYPGPGRHRPRPTHR